MTGPTSDVTDQTAPGDEPVLAPSSGRRRRHRRAGRAVLVAGVLLLLVVVGAVWGALSAASLQRHSEAAAKDAGEARAALGLGDLPAASTAVRAAAHEAAAADGAASSPPLVVASWAPGQLGSSVSAVRRVVDASHVALSQGAVPLLRVASRIEAGDELTRADGSIDVSRLQRESAAVAPAAAALARARVEVASVDATDLPTSLRGRVRTAKGAVDQLATRAGSAAAVLKVLPASLGADGPRTYLVIFQNTAELRPTGGIAGTWAQVAVDDGRVSLTKTGADSDLTKLTGTVRDLGTQFQANYPQDKVALIQDANLSPHFPYAAQLYSDLWVSQGYAKPDGVIAVDPSGMAGLLKGAGDIQVAGGPTVNAGNVVDVMLRQVYLDFASDNDARKEYLSSVVGQTFRTALAGGLLKATTLQGLVTAATGQHLLAWSARADEQRELVAAGVAGQLPRPSSQTAGVYLTNTTGVYLTNTAASKLDYYVTEKVETVGGCAGVPAVIRVVLHNAAPATVPEYVANKVPGTPATTESLYVAFYVPPTRGVSSATVNGQKVPFGTGIERGWSLVRLGVTLPRDSDTTITVSFTGASAPIQHVLTGPMVTAPVVSSSQPCAG